MTRIEVLNEHDTGKRKGTAVDPLTWKKIRWVNTSWKKELKNKCHSSMMLGSRPEIIKHCPKPKWLACLGFKYEQLGRNKCKTKTKHTHTLPPPPPPQQHMITTEN